MREALIGVVALMRADAQRQYEHALLMHATLIAGGGTGEPPAVPRILEQDP